MGARGAILCAVALGASGCMQSVTEVRTLPPIEREGLVPEAEPASPVAIDFVLENGVARGHLRWADSCRRVALVRDRLQEVTHAKPNRGAAGVIGATGLVSGAFGIALLANRNQFSPVATCEETEDGSTECSSPRGDATGLGVMLVGTAIALVATSIGTFAMQPSKAFRDIDTPTREDRVLAEGVPCGEGPVAWLEVALYRGDERIAASTTDGRGNVAFSVPAWLTGPVRLVADARSWHYDVIAPGRVLGEIVLEPGTSSGSW